MTAVALEWFELEIAASVGVRRRVWSMYEGRKERYAPDLGDSWGRNIEGAAAEMAYAKAAGVYWGGHVNRFRKPDVGSFEVKQTEHENGHLTIPLDESPESVLVLVTGAAPRFVIRGHALARDVMRPEYLRRFPERSVYWVPQSALRPVQVRL